jgi:LuxR family maltose regulon positive regulatory protein
MSLAMMLFPLEIVVNTPQGPVRVAAQVTASQADRVLALARSLEDAPDAPPPLLSRREQQVLTALSRGLAYKEVARELDVSLDTVRCYVRTLYRKLEAHSVTEALAAARELGLV